MIRGAQAVIFFGGHGPEMPRHAGSTENTKSLQRLFRASRHISLCIPALQFSQSSDRHRAIFNLVANSNFLLTSKLHRPEGSNGTVGFWVNLHLQRQLPLVCHTDGDLALSFVMLNVKDAVNISFQYFGLRIDPNGYRTWVYRLSSLCSVR